ncbi:nicotinamide riboside transporter PnuC [Aliidiomarina haloalkalitolerans]|uniref:Nicotinamide riboside transporter PnuC n=1 Tax=Aliidiomarina haloalkalitolerans TaxID=859059 RepID=A0A432VUQ7_9GAMM|nr:nicotinamide riboside transporter PnuC [Aliidiomarina haloalkalitolerans]RUO20264.1 nicotinamide mononucleotide transporter [Aliidiomarina haloalkalitolerans]
MDKLVELLALSSTAELIAVAMAIAYVLLAIRQSLWCWPAAIISASIYTVLFFQGRLYMETLLQVFYVVMAVYGYWSWRYSSAAQSAQTEQLPIGRKSWQWHLQWGLVLLPLSLAIAWLLQRYTDADFAYLDSITTVFSFFATFLVARKLLENWLYWIVIDLLYVGLFWFKGFHATAVLFAIYTIMAIVGYLKWRQALQSQPTHKTTVSMETVAE